MLITLLILRLVISRSELPNRLLACLPLFENQIPSKKRTDRQNLNAIILSRHPYFPNPRGDF